MVRASLAPRACPRLAVVAILVAVSASLSLAGCGRKGPLELPPGTPADPVTRAIDAAEAPSRPAARAAQATDVVPPGPVVDDPGLIQPPNKSYQVPASVQLQQAAQTKPRSINGPPGPKPGKPFVLDPLL